MGFVVVSMVPRVSTETIQKKLENYQKGPHDLLGAKFSAIDSDNDKTSARHCAKESHSGWWFNGCAGVNLNGDWSGDVGRGIYWDDANTAVWDNLKYSKMFIGPTRSQEWRCLHGKQ